MQTGFSLVGRYVAMSDDKPKTLIEAVDRLHAALFTAWLAILFAVVDTLPWMARVIDLRNFRRPGDGD